MLSSSEIEPSKPPRFDPQQRRELSALGLSGAVIDAIEANALPRAKEVLSRKEPARTDVIDKLLSVRTALSDAHKAVELLLKPPRSVPNLIEARANIGGRAYRFAEDQAVLKRALEGIAESVQVMDRAIASVPQGQTRKRSANTMAIEIIHDVLQLASERAGCAFHPPGMAPSSSPGSPFRKLIGFCFAALGEKTTDPERALKAYMKHWRFITEKLRRGPLGQFTSDKPDLPS